MEKRLRSFAERAMQYIADQLEERISVQLLMWEQIDSWVADAIKNILLADHWICGALQIHELTLESRLKVLRLQLASIEEMLQGSHYSKTEYVFNEDLEARALNLRCNIWDSIVKEGENSTLFKIAQFTKKYPLERDEIFKLGRIMESTNFINKIFDRSLNEEIIIRFIAVWMELDSFEEEYQEKQVKLNIWNE